jgi:Glycosyl transferase family 2
MTSTQQQRITRRQRIKPSTSAIPPTRVSVVIPCYNYARFLPAAVASVLTQADVEVDVIIVDDFSTDQSLAVANQLAEAHANVRVLAHPHNCGPVTTFNDGLAKVTGEYIVRLDADDMLTPGSMARSVALATRFPSVGLVYGHPVHFIESEEKSKDGRGWGKPVTIAPGTSPPYRQAEQSWTVWPGRSWLQDRCRTGLNVITSPEVLMRAAVVDRVGGQKDLPHTHDMEMWLRIATVSDVGHIGGADQAWHREHPQSLSMALSGSIDQWKAQQLAFDSLFQSTGAADPQLAEFHADSRRAIACGVLREACHAYDRGRAVTEDIATAQTYALELYPKASELPVWRGLRRRRLVQAQVPVSKTPYAGVAATRRLVLEYRARRWKRDGI